MGKPRTCSADVIDFGPLAANALGHHDPLVIREDLGLGRRARQRHQSGGELVLRGCPTAQGRARGPDVRACGGGERVKEI